MKITLRQLEVFAAVVATGGVGRAGGQLGLTQAAASMALAELERLLGVRVFDRIGRQLVLNEVGRTLAPRALALLERAHDFEALAAGTSFELRLGASVTIGNHLLPAVIVALRRSHSDGQVQVARFNSEQVVAELLALRIDIGFVEGPVEHPQLRCLPWRQDRLQVFAAASHPLAGRVLDAPALRAADWILREHGSGTREVFERAAAAAGFAPRVVLELEQPEAIRQCVRAGLGLGCLSELELDESLRGGGLVRLDAPGLALQRELQIVLHRDKFPGRGVRALLDACRVQVPLE